MEKEKNSLTRIRWKLDGPMLDGTEHFECVCGSAEHTLRFVYDSSENEIYTSVYLNQFRPWWKRIIVAIGYVFGYRCRYGHWDCFTLRAEDVERLANILRRACLSVQER